MLRREKKKNRKTKKKKKESSSSSLLGLMLMVMILVILVNHLIQKRRISELKKQEEDLLVDKAEALERKADLEDKFEDMFNLNREPIANAFYKGEKGVMWYNNRPPITADWEGR